MPEMSLQLRLHLMFPHVLVLTLGIFMCILGIGSIILSVIGFVLKVWGREVGTGIWCGCVFFWSGMSGIFLSQLRNSPSAKCYLISGLVAIPFAFAMAVLSGGGLAPESRFYPENLGRHDPSTAVHALSLMLGIVSLLISLVNVGIAFRFRMWETAKSGDHVRAPRKPPSQDGSSISRGRNPQGTVDSRASTSSRAPLHTRGRSSRNHQSMSVHSPTESSHRFAGLIPSRKRKKRRGRQEGDDSNGCTVVPQLRRPPDPVAVEEEMQEMLPQNPNHNQRSRARPYHVERHIEDVSDTENLDLLPTVFDEDELPTYEEALQSHPTDPLNVQLLGLGERREGGSESRARGTPKRRSAPAATTYAVRQEPAAQNTHPLQDADADVYVELKQSGTSSENPNQTNSSVNRPEASVVAVHAAVRPKHINPDAHSHRPVPEVTMRPHCSRARHLSPGRVRSSGNHHRLSPHRVTSPCDSAVLVPGPSRSERPQSEIIVHETAPRTCLHSPREEFAVVSVSDPLIHQPSSSKQSRTKRQFPKTVAESAPTSCPLHGANKTNSVVVHCVKPMSALEERLSPRRHARDHSPLRVHKPSAPKGSPNRNFVSPQAQAAPILSPTSSSEVSAMRPRPLDACDIPSHKDIDDDHPTTSMSDSDHSSVGSLESEIPLLSPTSPAAEAFAAPTILFGSPNSAFRPVGQKVVVGPTLVRPVPRQAHPDSAQPGVSKPRSPTRPCSPSQPIFPTQPLPSVSSSQPHPLSPPVLTSSQPQEPLYMNQPVYANATAAANIGSDASSRQMALGDNEPVYMNQPLSMDGMQPAAGGDVSASGGGNVLDPQGRDADPDRQKMWKDMMLPQSHNASVVTSFSSSVQPPPSSWAAPVMTSVVVNSNGPQPADIGLAASAPPEPISVAVSAKQGTPAVSCVVGSPSRPTPPVFKVPATLGARLLSQASKSSSSAGREASRSSGAIPSSSGSCSAATLPVTATVTPIVSPPRLAPLSALSLKQNPGSSAQAPSVNSPTSSSSDVLKPSATSPNSEPGKSARSLMQSGPLSSPNSATVDSQNPQSRNGSHERNQNGAPPPSSSSPLHSASDLPSAFPRGASQRPFQVAVTPLRPVQLSSVSGSSSSRRGPPPASVAAGQAAVNGNGSASSRPVEPSQNSTRRPVQVAIPPPQPQPVPQAAQAALAPQAPRPVVPEAPRPVNPQAPRPVPPQGQPPPQQAQGQGSPRKPLYTLIL